MCGGSGYGFDGLQSHDCSRVSLLHENLSGHWITIWNLFVVKVSKLTKSVKQISGANVTNSFQASCSVPDNARPLSFKNQNVHNKNFKMRLC